MGKEGWNRKFKVIKEVPSRRDLISFNFFESIPIGTILGCNRISIVTPNNMVVCDIGSNWEKEYFKEIT